MRLKKNPVFCILLTVCISFMMIACTDTADAADWSEKLNGRWLGVKRESVGPYGRNWYCPATIYEFRVVGPEIEVRIVAYGINNINRQELYSNENYLYFKGWIDGHDTQGTYYPSSHGGTVNDHLQTTEPFKASRRILLSNDGSRMNWGGLELTRE